MKRFSIAVVFSLIALCISDARGDMIPVNLGLVPASGSTNNLDITLTVLTASDTDTSTVTGNVLANLSIAFNTSTQAAYTSGIEFTGGSLALSNVNLDVNLGLLGHVIAVGNGIGGTTNTPAPPGPVTGTSFPTDPHELILNSGTFHAEQVPLAGDPLFPPADFDLAAEPVAGTTMSTGNLIVSAPVIAGGMATYDVSMMLPVDFMNDIPDQPASLSATGNIVALGQFSRAVSLLGDFNGDLAVNAADINLLSAAIQGGTPSLAFDLTGDNLVNTADREELVLNILGTFFGDAELNGSVTSQDFAFMAINWHKNGGWAEGDFDGSGFIDSQDFAFLAINWMKGVPAGGGEALPTLAAVPEPSTFALLLCGAAFLLAGRRRMRRVEPS